MYRPALHRFAQGVSAATFFLIVAGGLVTSTGSGLAVPDWPLSFGQFFPPMEGGVLFEHGHRMAAACVGLLMLALMIWVLAVEGRRGIRVLAVAAFGAVVLQALLGGVTVLMKLPLAVSVAHALLGQAFFCLTAVLALVTGRPWIEKPVRPSPELKIWGGILFGLVFIQLFLGAWMRHTGAGLAIPDFPLSYGMWIPPLTARSVQVHFAHRVGALVILIVTALLAVRARRDRALAPHAFFLAGLVVVQIGLGASTIWTMKSVHVVTTHVAVGALFLAAVLLFWLKAGGLSRGR